MPELPPHAEAKWRAWEREIDRMSFMVLIWGPGKDHETYDQRLRIREHLEACLPASSVYMSEDAVFDPMMGKAGMMGAEHIQAELADAIIVLATSPGALAEIITYREQLQTKALLFVEQSVLESGGFVPQTWQGLTTRSFTSEQLEEGEQIRSWAKEHVLALRFQKWDAARKRRTLRRARRTHINGNGKELGLREGAIEWR